MGGNLLTKGKRIPRNEYLTIEKEIVEYLSKTIGRNKFKIPRYYNTKSDFGDLDVVIDSDIFNSKKINQICFKDKIQNDLELPICIFNNGTLSTLYKNFQVDYFPVNKSKLSMLSNYMDYNIGNFIGKIARRFNLKYGMHGLSYVYRGNDNYFKRELLISNDIKRILEFFDLDYLTWRNGFNSNIDSYEWLIKSKYFSTYTYFNPKSGTKKGAKDRPEFRNFIKWLKDNNIDRLFQFPSEESKYDVIEDYFPEINIRDFIKKSDQKYKTVKIKNKKFNGNIIMDLIPNLKGKILGGFMRSFITHIDEIYNDFDNFVINSPQEIINNNIIKFYETNFKK